MILHVNIRGWLSNNAQLAAQLQLRQAHPQLILMNETKLNKSVAHPQLEGYEVVARKDNEDKQHGGGVLVYAIKAIASRVTYMGTSDSAERVWVTLHTGQGPYLIGCWYRAPSRSDDISIQSLATELEKHGSQTLGVILIGDMNVHHERWLGSGSTSQAGEALREVCSVIGLKQMVRGATHEAGNRLDLVLTSIGDVLTATVGHKVTDHCIVEAKLRLPMPRSASVPRRVHDYKKADWAALQDSIVEDTWQELDNTNIHEAVEEFTEHVKFLVNRAVPQRLITERKGTHP